MNANDNKLNTRIKAQLQEGQRAMLSLLKKSLRKLVFPCDTVSL